MEVALIQISNMVITGPGDYRWDSENYVIRGILGIPLREHCHTWNLSFYFSKLGYQVGSCPVTFLISRIRRITHYNCTKERMVWAG